LKDGMKMPSFCYGLKGGLAVLKPHIPPYSMNKDGHRGE